MPFPRRPLAFSLRTLLVLVGIACGLFAWLAYQRHIVLDRRAYRAKLESEGKVFRPAARVAAGTLPPNEKPSAISWTRRMVGDEAIQHIMAIVDDLEDTAWMEEARRVFPEAKFMVIKGRPRMKQPARAPSP